MSSSTTTTTRTLSIPAAHGGTLTATEFLPSTTPDADTPTLVLAHGWTLTRASWEPVVAEVQSHRAVRVIAYDQRGHGRSTWGTVRSQSIQALADDLATVIAETQQAMAVSSPVSGRISSSDSYWMLLVSMDT